eukprot:1697509-Alexandrium_andersonii.AAC.1
MEGSLGARVRALGCSTGCAGLSRAKTQGLRELWLGRLRIDVCCFAISRHRTPPSPVSPADLEAAREM